jgi:hypothetical protein
MIGLYLSNSNRRGAGRRVPLRWRSTIPLLFLLLGMMLMLNDRSFAKDRHATGPGANTVKPEVKQIGIGKDVKVKLADGRKLRGHLASIGGNSFSIRTRKHRAETQIRYDQVTEIKDPGPLTWILVGAAVAVIIIVVVH